MPPRVNSAVYYVTGASRGVGQCIAKRLLEQGRTVVSISRTPSHDGVIHISHDLESEQGLTSLQLASCPDGNSLIFFLNAAKNGADTTEQQWLHFDKFLSYLKVNCFSQLEILSQLILEKRPTSVQVVLISSYSAFLGSHQNFGYAISKRYLYDLAMMSCLSKGFKNIRFQTIVFGGIDSEMLRASANLRSVQVSGLAAQLRDYFVMTPDQAALRILALANSPHKTSDFVFPWLFFPFMIIQKILYLIKRPFARSIFHAQ